MRWTRGKRSRYVEDRRGQRVTPGKIGVGVVVLAVLGLLAKQYLGVDLGLGSGGGGGAPTTTEDPSFDPDKDPYKEEFDFVNFLGDDLQEAWGEIFKSEGKSYRPAMIVTFRDATGTACGLGTSAVGPFYCPGDTTAYLDLSFFKMLSQRFKAPGEFARAYVVAHEIGHHVQNLLGYEEKMRAAQRRAPELANELSVRFELQADCLAGVWGHKRRDLLEPGEVEQGLAAAAAIGDDTLQKQAGGAVQPESFTHGSSAQRTKWLRRGLTEGRIGACDTSSEQ
jgi:predicted metalloprotease